ncbi:MAG: serine hydrolase [Chloroflexi bacterium]|nr:serine hydrolase [Chloroflexota bacterium]
MLKALQKFLFLLLLLTGGLYLLYQGFLYLQGRSNMPPGMTIAGVDVSGLTAEETAVSLQNHYFAPVRLAYRQELVDLDPQTVGFSLNTDAMLAEAQTYIDQQDIWQGYLRYLIGRTLEPIDINLQASHDPAALQNRLQTIAQFLDQPAQPPQLNDESETFEMGQPGYATNIEASLPAIEKALYEPQNRAADLIVEDEPAPDFDINFMRNSIQKQLDAFSGMGSIFIMDLETGEEININADVAISGLSILKIAIFLETYRALDGPPNEYVQGLFYDTAVKSSNFGANLLLHEIAGEANTYKGADILTESMHRLGLVNTFMAVPYDAVAPATRPSTYTTPANSKPDLPMVPDTAMQTTAEEMGSLLSMIYYCAKGGGTLMAVYPGEITAEECQAIIDLMVLNQEGNLIRFGVPEDVPVSHKHGWDLVTHGDAGIVFSSGGDYVIVEYLSLTADDTSGWLDHDISFPILREISRAAYNYFNYDHPNLEKPADRSAREAVVREAIAATATAEAAAAAATAAAAAATAAAASGELPPGETAVPATPTSTPPPQTNN